MMPIAVLKPIHFRSPGDTSVSKKALKNNPVELTLDWRYLPSPAIIRFPFILTNMQGSTRYIQSNFLNPPSGWSDAPINHGEVNAGENLWAFHVSQRIMPEFVEGEYNENLILEIKFYKDPEYTDLDLTLTIEYFLKHYKSDDSSWNIIALHDFEITNENWCSGSISDAWSSIGSSAKIGYPGYGSFYSIYSEDINQNPESLQIYSARFDSADEQILRTLEQLFLDTKAINLTGEWIVFSGYIKEIKTRFGIAILYNRPSDNLLYKVDGYETRGYEKIYFSGVCMFYIDNYWHIDKIIIVSK